MSLRRLKWLTIIAPLGFLAVVDTGRHTFNPELLHAWPGYALVGGIVLFGALLFSETVFGMIGHMQARLGKQNRELLALHDAGLDVAGELGLAAVLQKVVEHARELIGARYGALSVAAPDGGIEAFLTSGISTEERARLGPPPVGHGLLGVVLTEGQRLRIPDIQQDPRRHGFPPHHPPMHSLLAVPVVSRGLILGNLYLTEKQGAPEFTDDDEATLTRFATQAALAIENARLHRQVRDLAITEERERIAREMHDSLAQVLGYVNAKSQAIAELVRSDQRERAITQIDQLGDAARAAYADVREGILGLRMSLGPRRGFLEALQEYVERWQEQSGLQGELLAAPEGATLRALSPAAELQLLRIVQEALANARKHALGTRVRVHITEDDQAIKVVVEDDGRGFDPARARASDGLVPRFGLSTMRERAEAVGGSLEVDAAPGRGTRVVVRIPANLATSIEGVVRARTDR